MVIYMMFVFVVSVKKKESSHPVPENMMGHQMLSPLGGFLPGMEMGGGLFPYLYPGMGGLYPGMPMHMAMPGLFPGMHINQIKLIEKIFLIVLGIQR